ncbi:LysM peptidoglycan-binding domain-containing protein [Deinococcus altitudinis]|uniref:C40 family peptidase n=1 Tax=Deinococcus altitudinis TaxID=468914 RepID=UPI0038915DC5
MPILRLGCLSLALLCGTLAGAAAGLQTYTVKPGDTAYSVARLAGTDPATLLRLNALSTPALKPGQILQLPLGQPAAAAPTPTPRTHTVLAGQTLYSVARQYGLKAADVQEFNHLSGSDLRPGQVLTLPEGNAQVAASVPAPAQAVPVHSVLVQTVPVQAGPPAPTPRLDPRPVPAPPLARHTVLPGQTLYAVARLYGLRPDALLSFNRLPSGDLHAGQVLLLPAGGVNQTPVATPGQTFPGRIFPRGTSPASAVPDGALLSPGVLLPQPPGPNAPRSEVPQPPSIPVGFAAPEDAGVVAGAEGNGSEGDWRGLAMGLLGVPYVYGGQSRVGTDCSGLVLQVFGPLGLKLPRQSAQQAQAGVLVAQADLQAGDLLFFDTEGRGTVTHVGIYLGDGAFINANSYGGQVAVNQLSDRYFAQRYLWARRVLGVLAQAH